MEIVTRLVGFLLTPERITVPSDNPFPDSERRKPVEATEEQDIVQKDAEAAAECMDTQVLTPIHHEGQDSKIKSLH